MEKDRNLQRVIQLLSGQNDPLEVIVPLFTAEIVLCKAAFHLGASVSLD